MLQVVESPTIGNRRNHCPQLQWGHRNAFSEGAHLANATQFFGNRLVRICTHLLPRDVVARQPAQPVFVGIVRYFFKSEFAAQFFEISIVGVGQRRGQIDAIASPKETGVSFEIRPSLNAASATDKLDRGARCAPLESASFWLPSPECVRW